MCEQCSIRQVNMTISLAFLAPGLVQAAIEGRLPREYWRHSSPRCACRVVPPICDAWLIGLIPGANPGRRQERVCRAQRPGAENRRQTLLDDMKPFLNGRRGPPGTGRSGRLPLSRHYFRVYHLIVSYPADEPEGTCCAFSREVRGIRERA